MPRSELRIGCQTFTWEMLGKGWTGDARDLVRAIAAGGYDGLEITDRMIGDYGARPVAFAELLKDEGLAFVSFAIGSSSGFTQREKVASDLDFAKQSIDFAAHFPGTLVSLGSATAVSDRPRDEMFDVAAECYNRTWDLGKEAGVSVAIHPSSHHRTLLFTREDYDDIFARLDPGVGWVPDTGHILRGGQDLADTLAAFKDRIRYVHLKDVDSGGNWAMLGAGECDVPSTIGSVRDAPHFNGWIVVEEESNEAGGDPAAAVRINRETLRTMGF
ncbi:sugar phosphate isomerase/epimerase family protein [Labrys okinawensis]|uniref:sugar phosphate isomerase/epimerase family protein n=1 Tax=Labrys okinawensis TaxID=346911 RepID=UPI0039BCF69F